MVFSDPYRVGGSLQTILEGSLQTKDVIDGAGCMYWIFESQFLLASEMVDFESFVKSMTDFGKKQQPLLKQQAYTACTVNDVFGL